MYMAGRFRTPSRPLRTLMLFALYSVTCTPGRAS
jgi:hypothetical protein